MAILKNSTVRQIMPAPIEGVVEQFSICQETGKPQVLVTTTLPDGHKEGRYFDLDAVEEIAPPPAATPAPTPSPTPAPSGV